MIDYTEFCEVLQVDPSPQGEKLFQLFDYEKSGQIDVREFMIGLSNFTGAGKDDKLKFAFMIFDEDGNGVITKGELTRILQARTTWRATTRRSRARPTRSWRRPTRTATASSRSTSSSSSRRSRRTSSSPRTRAAAGAERRRAHPRPGRGGAIAEGAARAQHRGHGAGARVLDGRANKTLSFPPLGRGRAGVGLAPRNAAWGPGRSGSDSTRMGATEVLSSGEARHAERARRERADPQSGESALSPETELHGLSRYPFCLPWSWRGVGIASCVLIAAPESTSTSNAKHVALRSYISWSETDVNATGSCRCSAGTRCRRPRSTRRARRCPSRRRSRR